jgi:hypothetical protein
MINTKSFLIHILYRSFLSIQKIQKIKKNQNLESEKKLEQIQINKLIDIFCSRAEPHIVKLFYSILCPNNQGTAIYVSMQKWLSLTENSDILIKFDDTCLTESNNSLEQSCLLIECIDNIKKDAINLQFDIDSYIYKFNYSDDLLPNLIVLMEKICCLLDGYESCSANSDKIHDEISPLIKYWFKNW